MRLAKIIAQYFPDKELFNVAPFGSGHINDTYRVQFVSEAQEYILQRINTDVFTRPEQIIANHERLMKLVDAAAESIEIPMLFPTVAGNYLHKCEANDAWRMTHFIKESCAIEVLENNNQAFEAGRGYGWFAKKMASEDAGQFHEAISDFHSVSFRMQQLQESINNNTAGRLSAVQDLVDFYLRRAAQLNKLEQLIKAGSIPLRVVHNDTKINNLLFRKDKVAAVIDLDTVGPGSVLYDFGDSIRTIANTAAEDEQDLRQVKFNIEAYAHFAKGYLGELRNTLKATEWQHLYQAPVLMTFIMGIRFLTDYLNGDVYYKTAHADHNVQRSLVQQELIIQMEQAQQQMQNIITDYHH